MSRMVRGHVAVAAWIAAVLAAAPVGAQEPATPADEAAPLSDEELQALEAALQADTETVAEARPAPRAPAAGTSLGLDVGLILDVAGAWFSQESLQAGAHDPRVTGFNFQQLEMSFGASVDPYLRFDANLVFAPFGVEVEEAYASTTALPGNLRVRAGQFLTRFGRLNPTHPHAWAFLDQPLVNGKFLGGEGSRGLGTELSWLTPLPWYVDVIGSATMADGECCARSFYGADNLGVRGLADLLYTLRVEQFFPFGPEFSLLWGTSAQLGPNPTGLGNRTEIYGADLYLRFRPLDSTRRMSVGLQLEGMFRSRQVPGDVLQDYGGRAEVRWQLNPRWETGLRYEYVSGVDDDPLDPDWSAERQRVAMQVTFFPSHFSRLRLQPAIDQPAWLDRPIYAAMLGLEVLVGAHGSHEY